MFSSLQGVQASWQHSIEIDCAERSTFNDYRVATPNGNWKLEIPESQPKHSGLIILLLLARKWATETSGTNLWVNI